MEQLKIENVTIRKTKNEFIFFLPHGMNGIMFMEFKKRNDLLKIL